MSRSAFEGGCLCRTTRFVAAGEATNRCYCHCRSCRLASGAPFVAWATFPVTGFRLLAGRLSTYRSSERVVRGFCPACGTALSYLHEGRSEQIDVATAAFDDSSALTPQFHIWVSHKLPWVAIDDGLPQYPEWRDAAP